MLLDRQKDWFFQNNQLQRCTVKHLVSFPIHPRTPKSPGSAPSSTRWLFCSTVFLVLPAKIQPFPAARALCLPPALPHGHREGHIRRRCGRHVVRSSLPGVGVGEFVQGGRRQTPWWWARASSGSRWRVSLPDAAVSSTRSTEWSESALHAGCS
jgi:hypothetical protein